MVNGHAWQSSSGCGEIGHDTVCCGKIGWFTLYSWLWCIKVEVHLNVVQFAMLHLVLVGFGTVVCS